MEMYLFNYIRSSNRLNRAKTNRRKKQIELELGTIDEAEEGWQSVPVPKRVQTVAHLIVKNNYEQARRKRARTEKKHAIRMQAGKWQSLGAGPFPLSDVNLVGRRLTASRGEADGGTGWISGRGLGQGEKERERERASGAFALRQFTGRSSLSRDWNFIDLRVQEGVSLLLPSHLRSFGSSNPAFVTALVFALVIR